MAWDKPRFSRKQVNWAGDVLIGKRSATIDECILAGDIVSNWRRSHYLPLTIVRKNLDRKAERLEPAALVFHRNKRLPSIVAKLRLEGDMALSQMQDIGGCRAVFTDCDKVYRMAALLQREAKHQPKIKDYIENPQTNGYRSLHIVRRYHSAKHPEYDKLRIEIQLRTQLQHAWATAFEVVEYMTGVTLRRAQEEGDWKRFFQLMATALAMKEGRPLVPWTPTDRSELKRELIAVATRADVIQRLGNFGTLFTIHKHLGESHKGAYYYLLNMVVNTDRGMMLNFAPYKKSDLSKAMLAYEEAERNAVRDAHTSTNVVLVAVKSVKALKKAYPNYFADTGLFLNEIAEVPEWET